MDLVILVIMLALIEYIVFSFRVGMARNRYGIPAPAVTGNPVFERLFRVQQNTQEQLLLFLPVILGFAWTAEAQGWPGHEIAAVFGLVWIAGRAIYAIAYERNPASRTLGFMLTFLPSVIMLLGTVFCVVF